METGLPVINVSAFAADAAPSAEQDEVAALLDSTLRETGFFLVDGHGVEPAVKAAMFDAMRAFFALPLADKQAIAIGKSPCHRGYVGIATEALDDKDSMAGDLKETLDTGGEHGPDHPEVIAGVPLFGPNQFPDLPGFRATWAAYRTQVIAAANRVQRGLARALGLPDTFFIELPGGETMFHLRLIHYPPQQTFTPAEGQLGCGAHTDYGTVTLLADDGIGGLQVMRRDGVWINVRIPDHLLVVNLGDLMAIWTNDRWVSNPHRVVNPPDADRYSMPLFVTPPYHSRISCLESCLAPGESAPYEPQLAGEYLMSRLDATHSYRNPLLAELNG